MNSNYNNSKFSNSKNQRSSFSRRKTAEECFIYNINKFTNYLRPIFNLLKDERIKENPDYFYINNYVVILNKINQKLMNMLQEVNIFNFAIGENCKLKYRNFMLGKNELLRFEYERHTFWGTSHQIEALKKITTSDKFNKDQIEKITDLNELLNEIIRYVAQFRKSEEDIKTNCYSFSVEQVRDLLEKLNIVFRLPKKSIKHLINLNMNNMDKKKYELEGCENGQSIRYGQTFYDGKLVTQKPFQEKVYVKREISNLEYFALPEKHDTNLFEHKSDSQMLSSFENNLRNTSNFHNKFILSTGCFCIIILFFIAFKRWKLRRQRIF